MSRGRISGLPPATWPVVQSFLAAAGHDGARLVRTRELSGGLTGARVFLCWFAELGAVVIKMGEATAIQREFTFRGTGRSTPPDDAFVRAGFDVLGDAVAVSSDTGEAQLWRAMAYPYFGARSYATLADYGDVGDLVGRFVGSAATPDDQITRTLKSCFVDLVATLRARPPVEDETWSAGTGPLSDYLPRVPWIDGVRQVIATVAHLLPSGAPGADFEAWFERSVRDIAVAPVHDWRALHGDPRFANVLVDQIHARVELIDYGNGRVGHIFADLARFEVDLWFRGAPRTPTAAVADAPDPSHVLQAIDLVATDDDLYVRDDPALNLHSRALVLWRQALRTGLPQMNVEGANRMYRWFLRVELLKRIRWLAPESTSGPGVDGALLLECIGRLRLLMDRTTVPTPSLAETPVHLTHRLGCTSAFVPLREQEPAANDARNRRKQSVLRMAAGHRGAVVRLLAETGQTFLDPRRPFRDDVARFLHDGGRMEVVIADPFGDEGRAINRSYRSTGADSTQHSDLLDKCRAAVRGALVLSAQYPGGLELRVATSGIGASILLTPHAVFYEPYFRIDRDRRRTVLFDTFELLIEPPESHGGQLLAGHADFHWKHARAVDLRRLGPGTDPLDRLRDDRGAGDQ